MNISLFYGTTEENNQLLLPAGELTVDTERKALRLHDGETLGGYEIPGVAVWEEPTGPGPREFIAGTWQAGFFGEVPVTELLDGPTLAAEVGLSAGTAHNNTSPWLKFALRGRLLYIAKRTYRYNLSWQALAERALVDGDTLVEVGGHYYRVRLPQGAYTNPSGADVGYDSPSSHDSEWNRLFYRICRGGADDVFASSSAHADWASYSLDELGFTDGLPGRASWCQEVHGSGPDQRVHRGNRGVSRFSSESHTTATSTFGWRPVLEWVNPNNILFELTDIHFVTKGFLKDLALVTVVAGGELIDVRTG